MDNIDRLGSKILDSKRRSEIEDFIDNLNVKINILVEGLSQEQVLKALGLEGQEIEGLKDQFKEYMLYKGYLVQDLYFNNQGLVIVETTIKDEEEFYSYMEGLDLESVLDLDQLAGELTDKISELNIYRTVLYEDLGPEFLEGLMEKESIKLSRVFELFEKISLIEGYIPLDISISKKGLLLYQRPIKNQEDYLREEGKIGKVSQELLEGYYGPSH